MSSLEKSGSVIPYFFNSCSRLISASEGGGRVSVSRLATRLFGFGARDPLTPLFEVPRSCPAIDAAAAECAGTPDCGEALQSCSVTPARGWMVRIQDPPQH